MIFVGHTPRHKSQSEFRHHTNRIPHLSRNLKSSQSKSNTKSHSKSKSESSKKKTSKILTRDAERRGRGERAAPHHLAVGPPDLARERCGGHRLTRREGAGGGEKKRRHHRRAAAAARREGRAPLPPSPPLTEGRAPSPLPLLGGEGRGALRGVAGWGGARRGAPVGEWRGRRRWGERRPAWRGGRGATEERGAAPGVGEDMESVARLAQQRRKRAGGGDEIMGAGGGIEGRR